MPICPSCKGEFEKRKNGGCPGCGTPVNVYNGYWYLETIGSPTVALVEEFENQVSRVQSALRQVPVIYRITRKGARYRRELVVAQRLLEAADGDYELTKEALVFLFFDPQFNFKTRVSLIGIERDYGLALSIVTALREEANKRELANEAALRDIMESEDIFA